MYFYNIQYINIMKKIAIILLCGALFTGCIKKEEEVVVIPQWEYEVVRLTGSEVDGTKDVGGEFFPMSFYSPTAMLDNMGKEGWELVSTYTEVGTAYPNFGNSDYVTGIKANTRTIAVNFVFKRLLLPVVEEDKQ